MNNSSSDGSGGGELLSSQYSFVLLCFVILFSSIALFTTLAFQSQRRFPINIVAVILLLDLLLMIFELIEFAGGFAHIHRANFFGYCKLAFFVPTFVGSGVMISNTLLSFSIFTLVKQAKDMSFPKNPQYAYSFVAIFLAWQIIFPAIVTSQVSPKACDAEQLCVCDNSIPSRVAVGAMLIPFLLCVVVQITFLGITLRHVWNTSRNSNARFANHRSERKKLLLYVRMVSIVSIQILQWLLFYIWVSGYNLGKAPAGTSQSAYNFVVETGALAAGYVLGPIVVMVSNRALKKWFYRVFLKIFRKNILRTESSCSSFTGPHSPRFENDVPPPTKKSDQSIIELEVNCDN